jgi:lysozyme
VVDREVGMTSNGGMRLSRAGAEFIGRFEGFRAEPYNDADSPPNATIGYGHVLHSGPVTAADQARYAKGMSRDEALQLLERDAAACAEAVHRDVRVPLNQAQVDALISFAYNVGAGGLGSSTLLRDLNSGDTVKDLHSSDDAKRHAAQDAVRSAFLMWDRGSGAVLPGLEKRRTAEAHLFMTGDYGS